MASNEHLVPEEPKQVLDITDHDVPTLGLSADLEAVKPHPTISEAFDRANQLPRKQEKRYQLTETIKKAARYIAHLYLTGEGGPRAE